MPYPLMTDFEKGYILGLFEGEGFIAFNHSHRERNPNDHYYTVHIGIVNTNYKTLKKIKSILKFGSITEKPVEKRWKRCWQWRISKQSEIFYFLKILYPYLIIKKEKATLLLKFLESRINCNPNSKANCKRIYSKYELGFYKKYQKLKSYKSQKEVYHSLP